MLRTTLTSFTLLLLLFLGNSSENYAGQSKQNTSDTPSGTFQKMIVENGTVTLNLDLNGLNGSNELITRPVILQFVAATNSFFPILVWNDQLRGTEPGSIALVLQGQANALLPSALVQSLKQLAFEKLSSDAAFDLAVRDGKTGFTFFNVEGHEYNYDPDANSLSITGGKLLLAKDFADALGRPLEAGALIGSISVGAAMQPVEVQTIVNGETKSVVMPPLRGTASPQTPTLVAGPDVIVGVLPEMAQYGSNGNFVGLGIWTTSCNNGDQPLHWFALPQIDHPVIPQNFYRMSGGANNNDRFEQIGQSWLKHAFAALEGNDCNFGCNTNGCTTGTNLCAGCSDPYGSSLNASQTGIGSRAWVNPFTGSFPSGANNHNGHNHTGTSHRVTIATTDLDPTQNPGATYFAEAQYVTPHEYSWCQSHPGQCNMFNNASYRRFNVSGGPANFTFSSIGSTVKMQPAIMAWTGATVSQVEPDPGNDGIWFFGYKVTGPTAGIYHYEYAVYNQNLD